MAEHFKLEITNRSTKITTWTGVSQDFAEEFRECLTQNDSLPNNYIWKQLSNDMGTVFAPQPSKKSEDAEDNNGKGNVTSKTEKENTGKYAKFNYQKRINKRRSTFKTLAYINFFVPNVQFVTLTFDGRIFKDANDLAVCHKAFQKFIKRVRHQYDDFKYLAVFSRQKNSNWHYHMLCNFDETVSGQTIGALWTYGLTDNLVLTKYQEFETRISYCIDNMEQVAWDSLQGEKGYLSSKGLQNKVVLRSWNENEEDDAKKYLSEILQSDEYPVPLSSIELPRKLSPSEINQQRLSLPKEEVQYSKPYQINHLVSQKGFRELFEAPVVAKKKG